MQRLTFTIIALSATTLMHAASEPKKSPLIGSKAATIVYAQISDGYVAAKPGFGKSPIADVYKDFCEQGIARMVEKYPRETELAQETEISSRFASARELYDRVTEQVMEQDKHPLLKRIATWNNFNNAREAANRRHLEYCIPGFKACDTHKDTIIANSELQLGTVGSANKLSDRSLVIRSLLVSVWILYHMETTDPTAFEALYVNPTKIPTAGPVATPEITPSTSSALSMVTSFFQRKQLQ